MMHYWGYPNMMGWGLGGGILSLAFNLLFWLFIALLIASVIRSFRRHDGSEEKEGSALNILKERFAKGEIDKKEFEEIKKTIQ